jgi:hypothetical protein
MFETLFRVGFVFALVTPPLAVLAGVCLLIVPKLHWTRHMTSAPVHP